ncbi:uncharacterized protein PV07_12503 [Cladophialophora immunda]|uniref:Ketoreductase domain-containing protein n=1 Tax=Cladophialophora immunda TaxID=569365 RepID=A0A0D1Z380_9EURO|nr:uncharacterized protein PV07_12503 [Cladophialophora immunda]KIW22086.1 hypothetical protein PV07_12503 [Cladophialophora immunda]
MDSPQETVQLDNFHTIFGLAGKVAVVTGGSRGLGLQTASGFLQSGCSKVYLVARGAADLDAAAEALNSLSTPLKHGDAKAIPIVADISTSTDHVDVLVANAGATFIGRFDDYKEQDFANVMNVNVNSVFFSTQQLTSLLEAAGTVQDPSRVIMVSSVAGVVIGDVGEHGTYAYAASNAAVVHLMHNLAVELGPRHITVNVVAPGIIPTKMSGALMARHGGLEAVAKQVPDQQLGAKEDVAGTMVFLTSRASRHINGCTVVLDGGSFLVRGCA